MSVKKLVTFGAALFAVAAFAQSSAIGTVRSVEGIVTVTDGVTGGTAKAGAPIMSGMRFVTTSSGSTTLEVRNCTIKLGPNQALTVTRDTSCEALIAAVQRVGAPVVAAAGGSATTGALATGAILVTGANYLRNTRSVSSN